MADVVHDLKKTRKQIIMMNGGFVRKKVRSASLGQRMQKMRSERRMSLHEVSRQTQIQVKYLEDLESGRYDRLPAEVYVKGFLRHYAQYFSVNERVLIRLYERESHIQRNLHKTEEPGQRDTPLYHKQFVITPRIIIGTLIAFSVFAGFVYLYREVDRFISAPLLTVVDPLDGMHTKERVVPLRGRTDAEAKVFINDQGVLVDAEGNFAETITLQNGINQIVTRSINKFDKETSVVITLFYEGSDTISDSAGHEKEIGPTTTSQPLQIEISVGIAIALSVEADDVLVYNGTLMPGEFKTFTAQKQMRISSENGEQTFVRVNGREQEVLRTTQEAVKNILFTAPPQEP